MNLKALSIIDIIQVLVGIASLVLLHYTKNVYVMIAVGIVFVISVIVDFSDTALLY